jgi:diguanylate cyclase (GGDEF)-like protein/PAS domain S-box-containing protein
MKHKRSPPTVDPNHEILALIETLHETGQRLEELTAGEVDAVANRAGRTVLLQRAQDQLRHSEAAKQMAILNALPAKVALLNNEGIIISVNEAWRRFCCPIGTPGPGYGIGVNYLEICDNALEDYASEAHRTAMGIRSVLNREVNSYSMEIPFHSPTEPLWFLLTVTPLSDTPPNGSVVMYLNITERKRNEEALRRFRVAMDATADAILLVNRTTMRLVEINATACNMLGYTREELFQMDPTRVGVAALEKLESVYDTAIAENGAIKLTETKIQRKDGSSLQVEVDRHAQRFGADWIIVAVMRDLTERKAAEEKIKRLNRVYAVLSRINTLIVRESDRDELFRKTCRIAIETGQFKMAWIGCADKTEKKILPFASAGMTQELLRLIKRRLSLNEDVPFGNTLTGRAARENRVLYSNDVQNDPAATFRGELVKCGVRSIIVLPLQVMDEVAAVLALYSEHVNFFDEEELKLLTELAGDIAFAIDHIEKQAKLDYLAYYDVLTGLANRTLFLERVTQYMPKAVSDGHKLALCLLDVERFKNINDSLGQAAGDALLRQVSTWLTQRMGNANLLARLGADQFAMVVPQVKHGSDAARLIETMMAALLKHSFRLDDAVIRIAVKVGVALFPDDAADADILLKRAEAAIKKAKASGDRYLFFAQQMTESVAGKLALETRLRQALDNEEFVLYYQPKANLESGKLTGVEALIRWNDPRTGMVPPVRFIPLLEETGLIHEVGRWVLRKAVEDYLRWRSAGRSVVRIAVNVSALQLRDPGFIDEIKQVCAINAQVAAGLELEITESLLMKDIEHNIACLQAIRALGVTIAIDDFGTGFSSLSFLSKLPVDTLKIDRSFVNDMISGPEGLALVSTIISLAHALKLKVVAEGVETEEQSRLLRLLGCDEMQGYVFSKPVKCETFETKFLGALPAA